jgi:uncharacterized protein (DUF58 family)
MSVLDAQTLSRLSGVKLRARTLMEGVLSGLHKSPHQGQSIEFSEHKEYAPGDELRHLDWKAFGKFDRYYVKRFEHETNLRALLVVDASGSMAYGSGAMSKLEVARTLAGALGYLLVRQQDAAGLAVLQGEHLATLPPRAAANHVNVLLEELEKVEAKGETDLARAAQHCAQKLSRRGLVVFFSDFFDDHADGLKQVLALKAQRHDVAVFHLIDKAELEFPFDDPTLFLSMEDDRKVEVHPRDIKDSYLEEFHRFLKETKEACTAADVDYELVRTDEPLDAVLLRFLARREGGRR